jgi:imidazoleglycerol-phosphate dehydratase
MDEALVLVAIDISGRGMLTFNADFKRERLGGMSTENVREFFRAVAMHAGITLHIHKIAGENDHHVCEAMFKGFARALCCAIEPVSGSGPRSTKGSID